MTSKPILNSSTIGLMMQIAAIEFLIKSVSAKGSNSINDVLPGTVLYIRMVIDDHKLVLISKTSVTVLMPEPLQIVLLASFGRKLPQNCV